LFSGFSAARPVVKQVGERKLKNLPLRHEVRRQRRQLLSSSRIQTDWPYLLALGIFVINLFLAPLQPLEGGESVGEVKQVEIYQVTDSEEDETK